MYYDLIEWLGAKPDPEVNALQHWILKPITELKNTEEFLNILTSARYGIRLFCIRAFGSTIFKDNRFLSVALNDSNWNIRRRVVRHIPFDENFKDRLNGLLNDKNPQVRYEAYKAIPTTHIQEFLHFFKETLFDDFQPIREYAQFIIRTKTDIIANELYRVKISESFLNNKVGVVAGFLETASKQDRDLLFTYTKHPNARIRRAAYKAVIHLETKKIEHLCIQGIKDSNSKVRRLCKEVLQKGYYWMQQELEALILDEDIKLKTCALDILMRYGPLEALSSILLALTLLDEKYSGIFWGYLDRWYAKYKVKCASRFYKEKLLELVFVRVKAFEAKKIPIPPDMEYLWADILSILEIMKTLK